MKITVKKGSAVIIVDEGENSTKDNRTTLKYKDQTENVHATIMLMVDRCLKLSGK